MNIENVSFTADDSYLHGGGADLTLVSLKPRHTRRVAIGEDRYAAQG